MKRVLICDDAAFMRQSLKVIIEKAGFEIAGNAANGAEAVKKYSEIKPDIVTMDITMPEMDGIEAVKEIIKQDSNAKILMVSAMGQQGLIIEAMRSGAKGFIIKPFQEEKIVDALTKILMSGDSHV